MGYRHKQIVLILFFTFSCVAFSEGIKEPVNYKDWLITMAVQDGLNTLDLYVKTTYWYYLRDSKMLDYRVSITPDHLNYKVIYLGITGIFMVNAGVDKLEWQIDMHNLVRINAQILQYFKDKH